MTFLPGDRLGRADCLRSLRLALLTGLFGLLAATCFTSSARAGDLVYWANDGPTTNRISFANLDGSGGGNLSTTGAASGAPRGVAIDVAGGKVYWTNPGGNRISFANLDGSGSGGNLNTTGATVNRPNAAAVYPAVGKIYWANETGDRISFANLNNTGGGGNLVTTGATVNVPIGPAVDPTSGRIYWGDANPENKIAYAKLDGSGGANLNTAGATVDNPHGVALDPVAGRIYWANVNGQKISYANLNGSGGGNLNTSGATVSTPVGVAIDPSARTIYWANQVGNKISFAYLDGGGGDDISTPGATENGSRSPVLLQAPSGISAPTIVGGSTTGAVITCSQGLWSPDLLGSSLYRVPQNITYSWSLNGADIPGAGANSYTASAVGDYRCRATASNPAGSASQTSAAHGISPAPAPLAFGAKTLVTLRLASRRIPARGPLTVVVTNRNVFAIPGKLSARTTKRVSVSRKRFLLIKGKAFRVGAAAKKRVRLKLSKPLRRLLRRKGKLSLRLSAKMTDPAGNTRSASRNVSPRLKKPR